MIPVVIFGLGTMAKLAWRYFEEGKKYSVVAFSVDDAVHDRKEFCGIPVIASSKLEKEWPPHSCELFIALGYQDLNTVRQKFFDTYTERGYTLASCISSRSLIMDAEGIGKHCFIMEGTIIQPFSTIGDNCVCWSGSTISHDSHVGNHCFLAAHSVIGGMVIIGDYTFLGINVTVRNNVRIGKKCLIGAGSLVLDDLNDESFVPEKATPVASFSSKQALRFISI